MIHRRVQNEHKLLGSSAFGNQVEQSVHATWNRETMKQYEALLKPRTFFMALLLAGCAGGLQSSLAAQTAPAVIFTNPSSDAINVPTRSNAIKNVRGFN